MKFGDSMRFTEAYQNTFLCLIKLLFIRSSKHHELQGPECSGGTEDVAVIGFSGPVA